MPNFTDNDAPLSFIGKFNGKLSGGFKEYIENLRLFSRNVRLYLIASFLIGLTFSGYQLLLNLYLREQGSNESFIGTILSAGAIGMAVSSIPAAFIIKKIRLKPILILGTIYYGASIFALTWLPVSNNLVILSFIAGVSMTFYRVAAAPFFMRHSTSKERTYIFSFSFGVSLLASVLGSVFFGEMVTHLSNTGIDMVSAYRWTFLFSIGLGFLSIIPFSMIKAANPKEDEEGNEFSFGLLRKRAGLYTKLFIPYFVVGTGAGLIIPFLNIYFRDRFDQPPDKIGLFFTLVNMTMFLGIMAGPVMAKKMGLVRTMVSTQLISIPFMVILAFTYNLPLAIFAFLIRGALMNMGNPIGSNFSMEIVPKSEQGLVNAMMMLAWTSSWMISTAIGGALIEARGYTIPMLVTVVLYFVSSILYFIFFRKSEVKIDGKYKVISVNE
ncbi:MAG: MFS transporter [Candidatus Zixiibacteriota bacterium]